MIERDWTIAQATTHYFRWSGTGDAAGAIEREFRVTASRFD